eukprot:scaffold230202_cov23-Tisochrysis_lutea.AAC.1
MSLAQPVLHVSYIMNNATRWLPGTKNEGYTGQQWGFVGVLATSRPTSTSQPCSAPCSSPA